MLKLTLKNEDLSAIDDIVRLSGKSIKSKVFYPGFDTWLHTKFLPGLGHDRDIVTCRDKRYDTLIGFALLKRGEENKLCNLSPLIDGVGITQVLLDTCHFYFDQDYTIDVPLLEETRKLHDKLNQLGFELLQQNTSQDLTIQKTYIKAKNIGWI